MTAPAPDDPPLFNVVLTPHRSLSPMGFWLLMGGVALVSFTAGLVFLLKGAWPVFGFFGVDVALVYFAFRASYKSGHLYETVRLTRGELAIERVLPSGQTRSWSFQPYWLRVHIDEPPVPGSQLTLTSHGRSLVIGSFLSPGERVELARALRAALSRARDWAPG